MTRKMISALLALCLCFSFALSVSAESKAVDFVIDELDCLSDEEQSSLNELAVTIYEETGVGIFFAYLRTDDMIEYDLDSILCGITDYVIMMENETQWYLHAGGQGQIIDAEAEADLRAIYDETPTYTEGVLAYLEAAAEYFPEVPAVEVPEWDAEEKFLYDDANLLTADQQVAVEQKLQQVSHAYGAQLVVATMPSLEGESIDTFVHYLYDSMGFGYGENKDGVLLLICMDVREYRILSNGYAGVAIASEQIDALCDIMNIYLPDGHYAAAFDAFADQCEEYLDGYLNGYPFNFGTNLIISLVIGLVAGLIGASVLKGQLKSVYKQSQANAYLKQGSVQIDVRQDIFLYRHVTRTARPKESDSDSDDSSRSVGGGSF